MKLEEPKRVKVEDKKLYDFDFEEFDKRIDAAIEALDTENFDDWRGYVMLGYKHDKTFPMGVILFKMPEPGIETEALKSHLRKFIENLDE